MFEDPPPQEALEFIEAVQNVLTLTHKLVFSIPSRIARQYGIDTPTFKKYMKSADAMVDIGQGFVDKKMIELKEMAEKGTESSGNTQGVLNEMMIVAMIMGSIIEKLIDLGGHFNLWWQC